MWGKGNEILPRLVGCGYSSFSDVPDTISNRELVSSLKQKLNFYASFLTRRKGINAAHYEALEFEMLLLKWLRVAL